MRKQGDNNSDAHILRNNGLFLSFFQTTQGIGWQHRLLELGTWQSRRFFLPGFS
jgi:thiamine phosphate synthase YjbQ (UPF0047 family)